MSSPAILERVWDPRGRRLRSVRVDLRATEHRPDVDTDVDDLLAATSVAVVSYNTRSLLAACLTSALAAGARHVVVVDNASTDGSAAMVRELFPEVTVVEHPSNLGYGQAANEAMRRTSTPFVLLLNADTTIDRDALVQLARCLGQHPRVGVAGPLVVGRDGRLQRSAFPDPTPGHVLATESGLRQLGARWRRTDATDAGGPVPWVLGAALALRREMMDDIGGFDPSYFLYYEEVDLCRRARAAGWEVHLCRDATVVHEGGASTRQRSVASQRALYRSGARYFGEHTTRGGRRSYRRVVRLVMSAREQRERVRLRVGPADLTVQQAALAWRMVRRDARLRWAHPATPPAGARRRVLLLSPFVPRLDGDHGASRAIAEHAGALSLHHDVKVLCLRGAVEPPPDPRLQALGVDLLAVARPAVAVGPRRYPQIAAAALRGWPMWSRDWEVPAFGAEIRRIVDEWSPDVVHVELAVMGRSVRALRGSAAFRVLVDHDPPIAAARLEVAASRTVRSRVTATLDLQAWVRQQRWLRRRVDATVVFSALDRDAVVRHRSATPVVCIPFGVQRADPEPVDEPGEGPPRLCFVGNFFHRPNVDAVERLVRHILPAVWAVRPDVVLDVIGAEPPAPIRAIADERVVTHGRVDDLGAWLRRSSIVVAPIDHGGGMRVKVIDGLEAGKPVVASPIAVAGLLDRSSEAGGADPSTGSDPADQGIVLAETDEAFAAAILELLADPRRRDTIGAAGRRWLRAHRSWEATADGYDRLYRLLDGERPG